MTEKDIKGMRELMGEFLEGDGLHELRLLLRIKQAWPQLVGEEKAKRTKPYRLEKGRLYIGVDSHAWVQDMHYETEEIKTRIKDDLGMEIESITVKKINLK